MRKLFLIAGMALLISSCSSIRQPLYSWGYKSYSDEATRYEAMLYNFYHNQTPESLCALLCQYQTMVGNPGGERKVVPPGIYAEFGYLLLSPDAAQIFEAHATDNQKSKLNIPTSSFRDKGMEMLNHEMELYPESTVFLTPIIKTLSK